MDILLAYYLTLADSVRPDRSLDGRTRTRRRDGRRIARDIERRRQRDR